MSDRPATLAEAQARKAHYVETVKALDWQDDPARGCGKFSINEMHVVFTKVQNKEHWKLPIDWTGPLDETELAILPYAVPHFTGGGCSWTPVLGKDGVYRVRAPGYYACIGA